MERHHAVLKTIFMKLYVDMKPLLQQKLLGVKDIIHVACAAKNAVVRREGYSSHFLAHGYNAFFQEWENAATAEVTGQCTSQIAEARLHLRQTGLYAICEAGCAGAMPAVMNAIVDALSEFGITHIDMPATPQKIWRAIQNSKW